MTDLTNRTVEEVNVLIQKYAQVLEVSEVKNILDAQILVIIIDVAIQYINQNYSDLHKDWKTWCIIVLKKLIKKISTEEDVKKCVDDFITYYKSEYHNYINDLGIFASEFDRDEGFINVFVNKKIGGH